MTSENQSSRQHTLIPPHGGTLVSPMVDDASKRRALIEESKAWKSHDLSSRQLCDLELILTGGFSPLRGFMTEKTYQSVCEKNRLEDGTLWPLPITLDVPQALGESLSLGEKLALRDAEGLMLAVMHVESIWSPDREREAQLVFGSTDTKHPGVDHVLTKSHATYVGGRVEGIHLPVYYDYTTLRHTPTEVRNMFSELGWTDIVAFQTRNPMHRAHTELTMRAAEEVNAKLLIHPVVGQTKPGDVDHYTRVRCYQAIQKYYPENSMKLSLLPLAMRMGGPREALLHGIVRKNYGCNYFIIGRDHAGPGNDSQGKPFYGPYEAQELFQKHENELGIKMVPFKMMVYLEQEQVYQPIDEIPKDKKFLSLSGTDLREKLQKGSEIPEWFTYPEVATELRYRYPARTKQGLTIFFTGLSGSGKSTVANALLVKLLESDHRAVSLLDGDLVRKNLSSELGFSKEHRDLNILRIGYVASEITKAGGIAICCPIAPYEQTRKDVRSTVEPVGGFVLVHVATPLDVCETRDRKGLYAKARQGIIKQFTGISDPYEEPAKAEIVLDTSTLDPYESMMQIWSYLENEGYVAKSK